MKVQRPGIYDTMERDIHLLHKATRFLPPIGLQDMVDIHIVLDELWNVAEDEMNFYKEASHMEEFTRRIKILSMLVFQNFIMNIQMNMYWLWNILKDIVLMTKIL